MKNVIVNLFLAVAVLVSCKQEVNEELNYSEKLLTQAKSKIKLIKLNNGYNFVPDTNITYIDLLILNDSTVEFNDSIYYTVDSTNLIGLYQRYLGGETGKSFGIKRLLPVVKKITDSTDKEVQFNFFFDSSTTMVSLNRLYEDLSLNFTRDKVKWINLFGEGNKYCQVSFIENSTSPVIFCVWERQIFKVLVNSHGDMMVENNQNSDFKYLKQELLNFYVNPLQLNNYPSRYIVNERVCLSNLKLIKQQLKDNPTNLSAKKNLELWSKYLEITKLIGKFDLMSRSSVIHIQIDNKIPVLTYYEIIDSVYGVVNQLKNTTAQSKFGKSYFELDSIHELKQKEALDIIYQPKINEPVLFPHPKPMKIIE